VGNRPVLLTDPMGLCKVELRYSSGFMGQAYHAFITVSEGSNTNFYRGGPERGRSSSRASGGVSDTSGRNAFGDLVTRYGKYQPGTIDWDPSAVRQTVLDNDKPCECYDKCLAATMDAMRAAHVKYHFMGPNSNTVASQGIRRCVVKPQPEPNVYAPGYWWFFQ
jgi:hypothetical protein